MNARFGARLAALARRAHWIAALAVGSLFLSSVFVVHLFGPAVSHLYGGRPVPAIWSALLAEGSLALVGALGSAALARFVSLPPRLAAFALLLAGLAQFTLTAAIGGSGALLGDRAVLAARLVLQVGCIAAAALAARWGAPNESTAAPAGKV